jgi:hypothetical protein
MLYGGEVMKTRTVIEREGEYMGPVDWSYDFTQHFKTCGVRDLDAYIAEKVEWLRKLEQHPDKYEATTDGGSPKFGWFRVLRVGMYDGWPHWRPVPAVLTAGPLGPEWHHFYSITGIAEI